MRLCLENAVLGTMSTVDGPSLCPQKINGEKKEKKTWGTFLTTPLWGYPQYE